VRRREEGGEEGGERREEGGERTYIIIVHLQLGPSLGGNSLHVLLQKKIVFVQDARGVVIKSFAGLGHGQGEVPSDVVVPPGAGAGEGSGRWEG
jgi:hypothetical protein